jgi:hypothetical protein
MIQESVPGERNSEKYKYRAVCSCGKWQGNLWAMKSFARHEGDMHERFPERGMTD